MSIFGHPSVPAEPFFTSPENLLPFSGWGRRSVSVTELEKRPPPETPEALDLRSRRIERMHFDILGFKRRFKCGVDLVKSDVIEIKRKPNQVFRFTDPENFVDAIIGHMSCVVYVGRDSNDAEAWKAYYWEPGYEEARKGYGYGEGGNILPLGSLAILEMNSEDDLEWELKDRAEETKRWIALFGQISSLAKKIRAVDEESEYADASRFEYMSADELENVLAKMEEEYQGQTKTKRVEV